MTDPMVFTAARMDGAADEHTGMISSRSSLQEASLEAKIWLRRLKPGLRHMYIHTKFVCSTFRTNGALILPSGLGPGTTWLVDPRPGRSIIERPQKPMPAIRSRGAATIGA